MTSSGANIRFRLYDGIDYYDLQQLTKHSKNVWNIYNYSYIIYIYKSKVTLQLFQVASRLEQLNQSESLLHQLSTTVTDICKRIVVLVW